ncbi:unnamed protein product [Gordionus sp. m RMFG-2023]|uniref:peptidyl-prolyl cis-trans isomerase FKBP4-like n=1 Tax=Gordionus sp. m RMFG-2023 TaxID=3053472 RepID=UPI0030DE3F89
MSNPILDISENKDNGVTKLIIKEGSEDGPAEGDKVFVHYVGTLLDGKQFDSSRERGTPFEFTLGKGEVIKGWDIAVKTMKKGELALITCKSDYAYGKAGSPPSIPADATLQFEIELLDFKPEDISPNKDGGILKSVLEKGEGYNTPNEGALVKIHIKGRCQDTIFQDEDLEITLDDSGMVVEGIEYALKKMKKGEKSRLTISSIYAYGKAGYPKYNIPSNSKLIYEIILNDFEKAKESWEMDLSEKLEQSSFLKDKGGKFFKDGKYKKALSCYKKINDYLQYEPDAKDEQLEKLNKLKEAANNNLAMCYLKLGDHNKCIEFCDKVLETDPKSEKAYFRKGMSHTVLTNYDDAISCFQKVLEIDPNNKAAQNQIAISKQQKKLQLQKEKQLYAKIFDKMAQMPPIESNRNAFPKSGETFEDFGDEGMMESEEENNPTTEESNEIQKEPIVT